MMFYLITKRIFTRIREVKDTIKHYMIDLDIRNFDGQNTSKAIISDKVLSRALGND